MKIRKSHDTPHVGEHDIPYRTAAAPSPPPAAAADDRDAIRYTLDGVAKLRDAATPCLDAAASNSLNLVRKS